MNTKLNNIIISPGFEDLFSFKNEEEKLEHDAQMISYKILSEIEKLCDERKIKKKDLAELVGTSKSYITQLFSGVKSINTNIMAKFENALNVKFEIRLKQNSESYEEFLGKQLNTDIFTNKRLPTPHGAWYYYQYNKETEEIINNLETENAQKQVA
jgi:transcriptional regulator with XRE-family HTH domain